MRGALSDHECLGMMSQVVSQTMPNEHSRTAGMLTTKLRKGTGDGASRDRGLDSGGTNFPHTLLIYRHMTIVEHHRTLQNE
jgi:hypothetical protein